jgi:quercetin dioxygenase-like cupin family protein
MAEDGKNNIGASIRTAEVVLPCDELVPTLSFFTDRLGFRIDSVRPADNPTVAVLSGHGIRIRLVRGLEGHPSVLRLACDDPGAVADGATALTAPNGTHIELVDANPAAELPTNQPAFVLHQLSGDANWIVGRAGMRYRDLIPDRQGGRFIASHIHIPDAGPVPDYVHFHKIRFQVIYCYKGWVRVVYEDQGPPFELQAGDCVLQPPAIRHRVLECSSDLEVIEIGCPAEHETCADHELELPTENHRPERDFAGQRFVRHIAADATWQPWRIDGFQCRDTGISAATDGLVSARIVRAHGPSRGSTRLSNDAEAELLFYFVLRGTVTLSTLEAQTSEEQPDHRLQPGDSVVIPGAMDHELAAWSDDFELLEVALPPVA